MQEYLKEKNVYGFMSKIYFFQIWQKARLAKANAQGTDIIKTDEFKNKNVFNKVKNILW